jgi:hypothetical protein
MPPGRPRQYADNAARQGAYRRRKHGQASPTAELIALQADFAQQHVHMVGRHGLTLQQHATAEQLHLQAAAKERDMMDALWMLQTLIADFGYDEVYTSVLQHLTPDAVPKADDREATRR